MLVPCLLERLPCLMTPIKVPVLGLIRTVQLRGCALTIMLLAGGCAAHQVEDFNRAVGEANRVLGARPAVPPAAAANVAAGGALPLVPSPAQVKAIESQATTPLNDATLAAARREAWPVIERLVRTSACAAPTGPMLGSYLGRDTAPSFGGTFFSPMLGMRYHPASQCLTVARIDGWTLRARNAISFRTVYASDASGETNSRVYELTKQPDGAWMISSTTG